MLEEDLDAELTAGAPGSSQWQSVRAPRTQLQPGTFVPRVAKAVAEHLGSRPGTRLNYQPRGRLAKFWYGSDASIHYEVWIHERTGQLELGLHFESTPQYNGALYKAFDACLLEIQSALGPSFWLEEWDHGWVRLYETQPLFPLDESRVSEVAERVVAMITTLQPILEAIRADLPPAPPPPPEYRRHHQGR